MSESFGSRRSRACAAVALCAAPAIAQGARRSRKAIASTIITRRRQRRSTARRCIDTQQAFELWSGKQAVFHRRACRARQSLKDLPKNAVWRDPKRFDIPGSIWLPDTGFGELSEPTARYFEQGVARASGGDKIETARLLLPHRLLDVLERRETRAHARLYHVFWYPEGTDGWEQAGHALEDRQPEPRE